MCISDMPGAGPGFAQSLGQNGLPGGDQGQHRAGHIGGWLVGILDHGSIVAAWFATRLPLMLAQVYF